MMFVIEKQANHLRISYLYIRRRQLVEQRIKPELDRTVNHDLSYMKGYVQLQP